LGELPEETDTLDVLWLLYLRWSLSLKPFWESVGGFVN